MPLSGYAMAAAFRDLSFGLLTSLKLKKATAFVLSGSIISVALREITSVGNQ